MVEEILKEAVFGSVKIVWGMTKVIVPLMIVIQLMRDYKILEAISNKLQPMAKLLGISREAVFPLIIGFFIGISYGAGAVMETAKEADLSKRDVFLIGIFLSCGHGILETTLIFYVIGANIWVLSLVRIGSAFILTIIFSKFIKTDGSIRLKRI